MLYSYNNHPQFELVKYLYFFTSLILLLILIPLRTNAQIPHLDTSLFKEGLLELKFNNSWRYQPGDNLEWASPDFDDSKWQNVNPIGLKAYQMPGSLWKGYGWWRINFTADPNTIIEIERLYFYSWGAAEIYLDGKLVASYGSFSTEYQKEKTYSPNY